jgi:hypothetical protein
MILRPRKDSDGRELIGQELVYVERLSYTEYYLCRDIQKTRYGSRLEARLSDATYENGVVMETFGFNLNDTLESFVFRPPEYYRKLAQLQSTLTQLQQVVEPLDIYEAVANQEI